MLKKSHSSAFRFRINVIVSVLAVLLIIELINIFSGRSLNPLGIVPRHVHSLPGIFTAPFIHGNLTHLLSNAIPLAVFTFLMMVHGFTRYLLVSLWIIIVGGGAVWLFGREANHIGASGVVYGYFAYLVIAGFFARQFKLLLISLLVMLTYGGMIWGVLPASPYISWESHLFGAIAGAAAAWLWGKKRR